MKENTIEPGLVQAFRWLVSLQLGMLSLSLLSLPFAEIKSTQAVAIVVALTLTFAILLAYLSWPPIQGWLGRLYLPIPIIIISLGPFLFQYAFLQSHPNFNVLDTLFRLWQVVSILFIPLVLVSWQYKMPGVVIFTVLTASCDMCVSLPLLSGTIGQEKFYLVGIVFTRSVSFLIVGKIISQLMLAQRFQRQELAEANQRLRSYTSTLEQLTVSRERNRLARELHDTLAHTLSATSVQMEAMRVLWDSDPQQARVLLDQILAATREGLTETRRSLQALRATPLEDLGLCLSIRTLGLAAADRAGFRLVMNLPDSLELPNDLAQVLFRTTQEALENVVRHAGAHQVDLSLTAWEGTVILKVEDDGLGFDPLQVGDDDRLGLRGIQERAVLSGGKLDVTSRPGQGTCLTLTVEDAYDPRVDL
jgi:signal transduction histidine kinase